MTNSRSRSRRHGPLSSLQCSILSTVSSRGRLSFSIQATCSRSISVVHNKKPTDIRVAHSLLEQEANLCVARLMRRRPLLRIGVACCWIVQVYDQTTSIDKIDNRVPIGTQHFATGRLISDLLAPPPPAWCVVRAKDV